MEIPKLVYDLISLQRASNGDSLREEIEPNGSIEIGHLEFMRVNTGILLRANILLTYKIECSRCLKEANTSFPLVFDEVFYLAGEEENSDLDDLRVDGKFTFDQSYLIDITEAVRQYGEVTAPMQPLCEENCQGLCPLCGAFIGVEDCGCTLMYTDPRWSALSALKQE